MVLLVSVQFSVMKNKNFKLFNFKTTQQIPIESISNIPTYDKEFCACN